MTTLQSTIQLLIRSFIRQKQATTSYAAVIKPSIFKFSATASVSAVVTPVLLTLGFQTTVHARQQTISATAYSKAATALNTGFSLKAKANRHALSAKAKQESRKFAAKNSKAGKGKYAVKAGKFAKGGKTFALRKGKYKKVRYYAPPPPSMGMLSGLHRTPDPLDLKSSVALVIDAHNNQVLFEKNAQTALPIASITKLMTALVVVDSHQDLNERLRIDENDIQLEQRVRSRLKLGAEMTRREALLLALMSSENRAANMLTRYYPGGKPAFVDAMNRKARQLGMTHSAFVEGTGLASSNMASAHDLVKLVKAANQYPLIRELSTQHKYELYDYSGHMISFGSTNRLIGNPNWDINLQKTGFISAAGQCLVMSANLEGRPVIMVFLDSAGKLSRLGDAQRVRDWLTQQQSNPSAYTAPLPNGSGIIQRPATSTASLSWTSQ